jgi:hypothetical protein
MSTRVLILALLAIGLGTSVQLAVMAGLILVADWAVRVHSAKCGFAC